ncbi:MAG: CoA transferase, partial [SAR202 cluster bacterium]|nr:CoA transferase [SAR202 cluster bacterium]
MPGLMDGVRVLDLGQRISAPYCARTFANMGAEVIKVEPPDGDEARRMGPFPDGSTDPETSGVFLALNVNKFGTSIDLTSDEGAQTLKTLVKSADILVENYPLGYLDGLGLGYETLREINPSIIHTSITPFGNWGPNKDWKANDLTIYQMSGNAHGLLGAVEDPYNDPPIRAGGHQSEFV